jgi:hypothetical protein
MKRILPLFIALAFAVQSNAQNYKIKWSEIQKSNGRLGDIMPVSGSDFYSLRWAGGIFGSYTLARHDNFVNADSKKIEMKVESGMANFEGARMIGEKLIVFLSDRADGKNHFFMQEYGNDLLPKGPSKEIATYDLEKGKSKGSFDVITSRDNTFFGVVWSIPGKKDAKDHYGFKIMDSDLNEVSSGDYDLPYDPKLCSISNYYLSNTGDYFLSLTEFQAGEKKGLRSYVDYKAVHILHITPDDIEDMTLDLDGKRIEAMVMNSDNDKVFTIAGIYGDKGKAGVTGLMYLRANFSKKEILDEGFEKFGKDFITQDWSDRQKEKAEKREAKGKGEPQLYDYVMRQTEVLSDGSIVGSLEQYYVVVRTYTDPKTGATRTTYTYYYNDIIAFKVAADGGFDWLTKINKTQISSNDGGYLSSYLRFLDNGKLCFVFNDNVNNYDEAGQFLKSDRGVSPASFSKKRNVVAIVEVDLADGSFERRSFFDRKEIASILVPKQCKIDFTNKEILLYSIMGRKERYGLMPFKE